MTAVPSVPSKTSIDDGVSLRYHCLSGRLIDADGTGIQYIVLKLVSQVNKSEVLDFWIFAN